MHNKSWKLCLALVLSALKSNVKNIPTHAVILFVNNASTLKFALSLLLNESLTIKCQKPCMEWSEQRRNSSGHLLPAHVL